MFLKDHSETDIRGAVSEVGRIAFLAKPVDIRIMMLRNKQGNCLCKRSAIVGSKLQYLESDNPHCGAVQRAG